MSGSDFRLTESARAVFTCERGTIQFYFVDFDKDVGKRFLYTLEEAAELGERIVKTGGIESAAPIHKSLLMRFPPCI